MHQQRAYVAVPQTERSVFVGLACYLLGGELCHQDANLEGSGPQSDAVPEVVDMECLGVEVVVMQEVDTGQIASGVVEEHVLGAGVGAVDSPSLGAGVPLVDGGVELHSRVSARPRGVCHLIPQAPGVHGLARLGFSTFCLRPLKLGPPVQVPISSLFDRIHELVGDANRVVAVLTGHREIGFALPVRVENLEVDALPSLLGEVQNPLDMWLWYVFPDGSHHGSAQTGIDLLVEPPLVVPEFPYRIHQGVRVLL